MGFLLLLLVASIAFIVFTRQKAALAEGVTDAVEVQTTLDTEQVLKVAEGVASAHKGGIADRREGDGYVDVALEGRRKWDLSLRQRWSVNMRVTDLGGSSRARVVAYGDDWCTRMWCSYLKQEYFEIKPSIAVRDEIAQRL